MLVGLLRRVLCSVHGNKLYFSVSRQAAVGDPIWHYNRCYVGYQRSKLYRLCYSEQCSGVHGV